LNDGIGFVVMVVISALFVAGSLYFLASARPEKQEITDCSAKGGAYIRDARNDFHCVALIK